MDSKSKVKRHLVICKIGVMVMMVMMVSLIEEQATEQRSQDSEIKEQKGRGTEGRERSLKDLRGLKGLNGREMIFLVDRRGSPRSHKWWRKILMTLWVVRGFVDSWVRGQRSLFLVEGEGWVVCAFGDGSPFVGILVGGKWGWAGEGGEKW